MLLVYLPVLISTIAKSKKNQKHTSQNLKKKEPTFFYVDSKNKTTKNFKGIIYKPDSRIFFFLQ